MKNEKEQRRILKGNHYKIKLKNKKNKNLLIELKLAVSVDA